MLISRFECTLNLVEQTLLGQLEEVLDDLGLLSGPGFNWIADQEQVPITVTLEFFPDGEHAECVYAGDLVAFASRAQELLIPYYGRPAPCCPHHPTALAPMTTVWLCPECDWACGFGWYHESQWPPVNTEYAAALLYKRFGRNGVTGLSQWGVRRREGGFVAEVHARGGSEQQPRAIRDTAAPIDVEVTVVPEIVTTCTEDEHYRTITWTGGTRDASCSGAIHRVPAGDSCDFLVGDTRVRFYPDHRIGPPGGPLVLCPDGTPIAYEGDTVALAGGWTPEGNQHLAGIGHIFGSGEMRVTKRRE